MDAQLSSPSRAYHGPTTNCDDNATMVTMMTTTPYGVTTLSTITTPHSVTAITTTPHMVQWPWLWYHAQHDNSAYNTMHGATTVPMTPCTVQQQCLWHHARHNDSSHNTHTAWHWQPQYPHSTMLAAATPMWCDNSTCDTTYGVTVATIKPNTVLHALNLLGSYVLID